MSSIITCVSNILETGATSLIAGTEDPAYPLYRAYDRDIGRIHKTLAAVTTTIKVDQGASPLAVDRLIIVGHNYSGLSLTLKWSDDNSSYTNVTGSPWTPADNSNINLSFPSITHRYWQFTITSPGSIPQMTEMFLTSSYTWPRMPLGPTGAIEDVFNIDRQETVAGKPRYYVKGVSRRQRHYSIECDSSMFAPIAALNAAWQGAKPFWMADHSGTWIYGELLSPLNERMLNWQEYAFDFPFREVCG